MIRVYLADAMPEERSTLRLMLLDLKMEIAEEADNWSTTLAELPRCSTDLLLVDWKLLPDAPNAILVELRRACPKALALKLISKLRCQLVQMGLSAKVICLNVWLNTECRRRENSYLKT